MELTYGEKHLINTGNFENITIEFTIKDIVQEGYETLDEAKDRIIGKVKETIAEKKAELVKNKPNITFKIHNKVLSERENLIVKIQEKCRQLVEKDSTNKDKIKEKLSDFEAIKISDLTDLRLKTFQEFLNTIE